MILALLLACPSDAPTTDKPADTDTTPVTTAADPLEFSIGADEERVTELNGTLVVKVAEAVTVTCTANADPAEVYTGTVPADDEPPVIFTFAFYGLAPETAYTCVAATASGASVTVPVTTGRWVDAPEVIQEGDATAIDGAYTVFNVGDLCRGDGTNTVWIADPEGRLRWRWGVPEDGVPDIDVSWLGDRFLIGGGAGIYGLGNGAIREVDLAGTILYERMNPATGVEYNHHVERLDDGTDLAVVWQLNEGTRGTFIGFGIERTDPVTDEVLFDWNSQTALDRGQLPAGPPTRTATTRTPCGGRPTTRAGPPTGSASRSSATWSASILKPATSPPVSASAETGPWSIRRTPSSATAGSTSSTPSAST